MRAENLIPLALLILFVPATAIGQANWTPTSTADEMQSALRGVSVGIVTLSPEAAKGQYNIQINEEQQFVAVQGIEKDSRASHSLIAVGDLIDTIIVGGEQPQHGSVRNISEFDRLASLCVPACLVTVRHKMSQTSDVISLGPVQEKFTIVGMTAGSSGRLVRIAEGTGMCGNLTQDPEETLACGDLAWYGFCDNRSGYVYFAYNNRHLLREDNWLSPTDLRKQLGVDSCYGVPPVPSDQTPSIVSENSALHGLHVTALMLNKTEAEARFGHSKDTGSYLIIDRVVPHSPSATAGILVGDEVQVVVPPGTSVNNDHPETAQDFYRLANRCPSECLVGIAHPAKLPQTSYPQMLSVGRHGAEFEIQGAPFDLTFYSYYDSKAIMGYGDAEGPEVFAKAFNFYHIWKYSALPPSTARQIQDPALSGQSQIVIRNTSQDSLMVLFMGQVNRRVMILSGGQPTTIIVPPGEYEIAAVSCCIVSVFLGREQYNENVQYVVEYPFKAKP